MPNLVLRDETTSPSQDPAESEDLLLENLKRTRRQVWMKNLMNNFFDILATESTLRVLSEKDPEFGRIFYRMLRGVKSQLKIQVLNRYRRTISHVGY